ncbi:alpha-amylase family protein [Pseudomonas sp. 3A(2025)]
MLYVTAKKPLTPGIVGIVWQPDNATVGIRGDWQKLGAKELLVQWSVVDDQAFVPGSDLPGVPVMPDWQRIAGEPWAQDVIMGLAGYFSENRSRDNIEHLAALSEKVAKIKTPLHVTGWYFPAEVDPSWTRAKELPALLAKLPRPLWISVYDGANIGPAATAEWLQQWLPDDIGVFFQDGVGVYARSAPVARTYADALSQRLGKHRVRLIVEAFRPQLGGGFRPATVAELKPQLAAYDGYPLYLFDGPHYVTPELVEGLAR